MSECQATYQAANLSGQADATNRSTGAATCPCESVWQCTRGRTRLDCELLDNDGCYRINLVRNSRVYGTYQFTARDSAMSFATRLRLTFEGNGWSEAQAGSRVA